MMSKGSFQFKKGQFTVIAGPCSIETKEQFLATAQFVKEHGTSLLRGGMFKLRTHPDSFQGLEGNAFQIVREVKEATHMPFISEVTDPRQRPKKEYNHPSDSVMALIYGLTALKITEEIKWNWISA